jgi:hypothetical protein
MLLRFLFVVGEPRYASLCLDIINCVYIKQQQRWQQQRSSVCGPGGEGEKQKHHDKSSEHCRVPVAERDTQVEIRFDMGLPSAASEPVASVDTVRTGPEKTGRENKIELKKCKIYDTDTPWQPLVAVDSRLR